MTIQPCVATRSPPGRPMTICLGSAAGATGAVAAEAFAGGVNGSGRPPSPATTPSPFPVALTANGSAPFADPEIRLPGCSGADVEGVLGTEVADVDPLLFSIFGTSNTRTTARITESTTTNTFC